MKVCDSTFLWFSSRCSWLFFDNMKVSSPGATFLHLVIVFLVFPWKFSDPTMTNETQNVTSCSLYKHMLGKYGVGTVSKKCSKEALVSHVEIAVEFKPFSEFVSTDPWKQCLDVRILQEVMGSHLNKTVWRADLWNFSNPPHLGCCRSSTTCKHGRRPRWIGTRWPDRLAEPSSS